MEKFEHGGNIYSRAPHGGKWLDFSAEVLLVEIADLVDVFCPDGDVLNFHEFPLQEYTNKFCMVPENLALFLERTLYIL